MQNQQASFDDMNTLSSCTNSVIKKGYTENFQVQEDGLFAPSNGKLYQPEDVKIDNFYRFEGASNPDDNAILFSVSTNDGIKGLLIDSYGATSDDNVSEFMSKVESIKKTEAVGH